MTSVGSTSSYTHRHQQNEMVFHVIIGEFKSHLAVYVQKIVCYGEACLHGSLESIESSILH